MSAPISSCLPLIQVVYSEGGFRRNEWFAPMPALEHESYPWRHARQICLQAREKILFLNREIQLARQNQRTTDGLWLTLSLQSLQGGLVFLESLLNSGHVHPVDLYRRALFVRRANGHLNPGENSAVCCLSLITWICTRRLPRFFALLRNQLAHIHRRWQRLNFNRQENSFTLTLPAGIRAGDQIIIGVLMPNGCTMPAQSWLQQSIIASQPFFSGFTPPADAWHDHFATTGRAA
ncbi:type VI secretion protein [Salmonella bongori]|nr:type VI secretion protein [Salmonella bongori]